MQPTEVSGPGLHYNHKLPWSSMADYYRSYKHTAILLPVGECKKIHVTKNNVKHQLKNRKYLHDRICTDTDCKTVGEAEFRKNESRSNKLFEKNRKPDSIKENFFNKFRDSVFDYINTVKPDNEEILDSDEYPEDYPTDNLTSCDRCNWFIMLLETKNMRALEKYDSQQLNDVFSCLHGGQAVGRNLPFLFYYVFHVYFITNIIFASGSTEDTSNWYLMAPDNNFRMRLMDSCDGQTFLPSCRKYLEDDVYMKDLNATKELCKKCFEFICWYTMMELRIRPPEETHLHYYLIAPGCYKSLLL